jgi:hypothetical protein
MAPELITQPDSHATRQLDLRGAQESRPAAGVDDALAREQKRLGPPHALAADQAQRLSHDDTRISHFGSDVRLPSLVSATNSPTARFCHM